MNTEDGAKLYDVCPHVSDSVRWLHPRSLGGGVGGMSPVPQPWAPQEGAWASRQSVGGWPGATSGLGQCFPGRRGCVAEGESLGVCRKQ